MYAKIQAGIVLKYPYTMRELQDDNPYTNFGTADVFKAFQGTSAQSEGAELVPVEILPCPEIDDTQVAEPSTSPTYDGRWVLGWVVRPKTAEELREAEEDAAASVRNRRNNLLRDTDWTQLADVSNDIQVAWKPYRQELRDLPTQPGFPLAVTWPSKPR